MFTPFGNSTAKSASHKKSIADVTGWVDAQMKQIDGSYHSEKYQIMVVELQCNEPDCVPIETLVAILLSDSVSPLMNETTEQESQTGTRTGTGTATGTGTGTAITSNRWAGKILKHVAEVVLGDVVSLLHDCPFRDIASNEPNAVEEDRDAEANLELATPHTWLGSVEPISVDASARSGSTSGASGSSSLPGVSVSTSTITRVTMVPTASVSFAPALVPVPAPAPAPAPPAAVAGVSTSTVFPSSSSSSFSSSAPALPPVPASTAAIVAPVGMPTTARAMSSLLDRVHSSSGASGASGVGAATGTGSGGRRHKKGGTRPRGCPCCDPDNLDNIIDSMMFAHYPPS
jgi:hypothetical protein